MSKPGTEAEEREFTRLREEGKSYTEVAEDMKNLTAKAPLLGSRAERAAQIQKLHAEGYNYREIGEKLGVTPSTVGYYVTGKQAGPYGHKARRQTKLDEVPVNGASADSALHNHISYCFGHCEAWLDAYARSSHVNPAELIGGVAALLRNKVRW